MISHVTLGSNDLAAARRFYDAALAPLGIKCVYEIEGGIGFAKARDAAPWLWILTPFDGGPASSGNGTHLAFAAASRGAVDAFHRAALAAGGSDEGAPGPRPRYHEHYYGGYVRDPDGNKLQAVCHRAP